MDRADIDAALERIRAGLTDGVVVAWLDRFSRAPVREALEVYDDINGGGRPASSPSTWRASTRPTRPASWRSPMMLGDEPHAVAQTAERYDQTRRDAIADGQGDRRRAVRLPVHRPDAEAGGHGVLDSRLVVDEPERAPIVRELFERKAGGATWLELARWLDEAAPKPNGGHWARSTVGGMIALPHLPGRGPPRRACQRRRPRADRHRGAVAPGAEPAGTPDAARHLPALGSRPLRGLRSNAARLDAGRKPQGRKLDAADLHVRHTADATARSTIVVDRLDAEVDRQFFAHLDAFHVRAVDDAELDAARAEVEQRTAEVERLAARRPEPPDRDRRPTRRRSRPPSARWPPPRTAFTSSPPRSAGARRRELRDDWPTLHPGRAARDPPRRDRRRARAAGASPTANLPLPTASSSCSATRRRSSSMAAGRSGRGPGRRPRLPRRGGVEATRRH